LGPIQRELNTSIQFLKLDSQSVAIFGNKVPTTLRALHPLANYMSRNDQTPTTGRARLKATNIVLLHTVFP